MVTNKALDILRGQRNPVSKFHGNPFPLPAVFCQVVIGGTYRLYSDKDHYTTDILEESKLYPGPFSNITSEDGSTITTDAINIRF